MKKIIFALAVVLSSCSSPVEKPFVEDYIDRLVEEYPNFASNEIAERAVEDSIRNLANSYVGRNPEILNGVEFKFEELFENNDTTSALFSAVSCMSQIDDKSGAHKYIITPIEILILGRVDSQTAGKLDRNRRYHIGGILHAWDETDRFLASHITPKSLFLGTYILNNMNITPVSNE